MKHGGVQRPCCIRGYHIYQEVWAAAIGEELVCERKPHNSDDRYAVAVKRMGIIISHLPRKLLKLQDRHGSYRTLNFLAFLNTRGDTFWIAILVL